MSTEAVFWKRYQTLRERARAIRDQVDIAGFDLEAMARTLPAGSYPESDWDAIVKDVDDLARHVREVRETAREKHVNGIEADLRLDRLLAGVRDIDELMQHDREMQEAEHRAANAEPAQ